MERNTLENLKIIRRMDKERLPLPMEKLKKVYGKMANSLRKINMKTFKNNNREAIGLTNSQQSLTISLVGGRIIL